MKTFQRCWRLAFLLGGILLMLPQVTQAQCEEGERTVKIVIGTDNWGAETSWTLTDSEDNVIAEDDYISAQSNMMFEYDVCLDECEEYTFTIEDTVGDGICCGFGFGMYAIMEGGDLLASGGEFEDEDVGVIEPTGEECEGGGGDCDEGQNELVIDILTDNWGNETTWTLEDEDGSPVASGGPYSNNTENSETICIDDCQDYTFTIFDSIGDGICCGFGIGEYSLSLNGSEIASGGEFAFSESTLIEATSEEPCPAGCDEGLTEVVLDLLTDDFGGETSWTLEDEDGVIASVGFGTLASNTNFTPSFCLEDGCYTFSIFDSFGDGICCTEGFGSWSLEDGDGGVIGSGGNFSTADGVSFTVDGGSISTVPTCSMVENDLCEGAIDVGCGETVSGSTSDASNGDAPGFCDTALDTAPGVWYSFMGTGDVVEVSTANPGTNYDTKLGVFSGSCGSLTCVGGDDDGGGFAGPSIVIFTSANVEYFIYVTGFGFSAGDFELSITCFAPPSNDDACDATPLAFNVLTPFSNVGASAEDGEPNPGPGTIGLDGYPTASSCNAIDGWCNFELEIQNSVWFTFTPPYEGCFEVLVQNDDLQLAIWEVDDCGNFASYVEVGANDDSADDFWAAGIFSPGAAFELGTTYYIQVDGFDGIQSENNNIIVRPSELCPNPCEEEDATAFLNILADGFSGETTWEIRDLDGNLIQNAPNPTEDNELNVIPLCLDLKECYEFTIFDSFDDGICCGFGEGDWSIVDVDGNILATSPTGGAFGSSETVPFSTGQRGLDCPDDFDIYTNQFTCEAYVEVPLPDPRSECVVLIEGRVRRVDSETLANIPGEGWSPWSTDLDGFYGVGTYKVRWRSTDVSDFRKGCTFYFTVKEVLPCPWIQLEDGIGCEDGNSATYDDGVFTINSTDCYNSTTTNTDEFAFVQQTLCGDGSITAEVTSLTGNALGWAGVTMREVGFYEEFLFNEPDGKSVTLLSNGSNRHRTEVRLQDGGPVTASQSGSFNRHWLRLVRSGPNFTGYVSSNGLTWIYKFSIQIDMDACIAVGMVVNSQWSTGDQTATFENVEVTGGGGGPFIQAITGGQDDAQLGDRGNHLVVQDQAQQAPRSFTAYPNPTTGLTTLAISDFIDDTAQLEVINTLGQIVLQRNIGVVEQSTEELDLTALPAGVYTIRLLLADGESEMIQVVKQ